MKRYDLDMDHYNTGSLTIYGLKPHDNGAWVKHEDAVKLVTELEQRLAAAESRIAKFVNGIKEAQIELIETGNCYEILEKLI